MPLWQQKRLLEPFLARISLFSKPLWPPVPRRSQPLFKRRSLPNPPLTPSSRPRPCQTPFRASTDLLMRSSAVPPAEPGEIRWAILPTTTPRPGNIAHPTSRPGAYRLTGAPSCSCSAKRLQSLLPAPDTLPPLYPALPNPHPPRLLSRRSRPLDPEQRATCRPNPYWLRPPRRQCAGIVRRCSCPGIFWILSWHRGKELSTIGISYRQFLGKGDPRMPGSMDSALATDSDPCRRALLRAGPPPVRGEGWCSRVPMSGHSPRASASRWAPDRATPRQESWFHQPQRPDTAAEISTVLGAGVFDRLRDMPTSPHRCDPDCLMFRYATKPCP